MSLRIAFRHRYPGHELDIDFEADTPGAIVLSGASGAGKSTIAAVAAGLLRPEQAHVSLDGTVLADTSTGRFMPPHERRIGIVFQDALLFPHLDVTGNLRYGLARTTERRLGMARVIDLLGLQPLLRRMPAHLSGGERQRVAIGRALLSQPRLLVMDEPLASLDAARRHEIMPFLLKLRDELAIPILYVTHAADEIARMADTLVLVDAGRVTAHGSLVALSGRADLPLARIPGAGAIVQCRVCSHDPAIRLTRLELVAGQGAVLSVPIITAPPGTALRVRIPAAEVAIALEAPRGISIQNILPARIHRIAPETVDGACMVELHLHEAPLLARLTGAAVRSLALAPGQHVMALVKSVAIELLDIRSPQDASQ